MKTKYLFIAIAALMLLFSANLEARYVKADFHFFYHSLRQHGSWIEMSDGLVVWRPAVGFSNWSPYSQGSWIWTDWGWYWDSSESFGLIVYHYGRWYFDDYYGWIWVPDYDWAPAWVEWRYDDDYIGWAPLHPYASFTFGIGITFTRSYVVHHHHWIFVGHNHFCDPYVYNYYVPSKFRYRIYNNTASRYDYTFEGSRIVNRGIDRNIIERKSDTRIRVRDIAFNERGSKNEISRRDDKIEISYDRNLFSETRDNSSYRFDRGERDISLANRDVSRVKKDDVRDDRKDDVRINRKDDVRINRKDDVRNEPNRELIENSRNAGKGDRKEIRNEYNQNDRSIKYEREKNDSRDRTLDYKNDNNSRNEKKFEPQKNQNYDPPTRSGNRDEDKKEVRNNTSQNRSRDDQNRSDVKKENQTRTRDDSGRKKDR